MRGHGFAQGRHLAAQACSHWNDLVSVEINRGVIIKRQYMKHNQEEADAMVVQQVKEVKAQKVLVVADDTDIFVHLRHFCCQGYIPASTSVLMVSPIRGRVVIDINATVDLHRDIIPDVLAAHGLDQWLRYSGIILRNWKGCGTKSPDIWRACSNLRR